MSEPVSISYKCKFCGNQQNKSLRSGPPNPGVCLKAPEDGKGWHGPHKWVAVPHCPGLLFFGGQASICSSGTRYSLRHCSYSSM